MTTKTKALSLLVPFLSLNLLCSGQLVINNNLTAEQLVNEVLIGEGVQAQNITFNNHQGDLLNPQIGFFNSQNSNIPISEGILLSTGPADIAVGPNDSPSAYELLEEGTELDDDPDLAVIFGSADIRDVAKLEFDFTAVGDTLKFRYVFASEEYNESSCTPWSDGFAFLISGPGIAGNGSFANNAINAALIPGSNTPVAINTINNGQVGENGAISICNSAAANWQENAQYFVDNSVNDASDATQFDGFTIAMPIEVPVVCGETYHIKMVIADAVDRKNDSAVFLEAGSFVSEPPLTLSSTTLNTDENGSLLEGCSQISFTLQRPYSTEVQEIYTRPVINDAPAWQMTDIPSSIVFLEGETAKNISVDILNDQIFAGERQLRMDFLQANVCSMDTATFSKSFILLDKPGIEITEEDTIVLECNASASVAPHVEGGYPPYWFSWSDGSEESSLEFLPDSSQEVFAVVTDQCGNSSDSLFVYLNKLTYEPLSIQVEQEVMFNCLEPVHLQAEVTGGAGSYQHLWTAEDQVISTTPVVDSIFFSETELLLLVSDHCGQTDSIAVQLKTEENPIVFDLGTDQDVNCTEVVSLQPVPQGGWGELSYNWIKNQQQVSTSSEYQYNVLGSALIILDIEDQCGQQVSDSVFINSLQQELILALPPDTVLCESKMFTINPSVEGGMGERSYLWLPGEETSEKLTVLPEQNHTYTLQVQDQCNQKAEEEINIRVQPVMADFRFDYDAVPTIRVINNSSPNCSYSWIFPDGSSSESFEPVLPEFERGFNMLHLEVKNPYGCSDNVVKFYEPPLDLFIPTAFSPNDDGTNDLFKVVGSNIAEFEMTIIDRWGQVVFHSTDISKGWNGAVPLDGEYKNTNQIYQYIYRASSFTGISEEGTGTITLLR